MKIAGRIQSLRKSKGLSQEELAEKIGVSRQAVSKWESEQSIPDIEKIILLSNYFETTTDYLLKGIEPEEKIESKGNAVVYSMVGTILNAVGLVAAVTIWLERQMTYAVGVGIVIMLFGTMIFLFGQMTDRKDKTRAKRYFILFNVWILVFIPFSCCFNILDGLVGGYTGQIAPIPLHGNSILTFLLYWIAYVGVCGMVDVRIILSGND